MKIFTYLAILLIIPLIDFAQTSNPVINWKGQLISQDNNLQGMTVSANNDAILIGYGNTFKKSVDKGISWKDVDALKVAYDCIDMSFNGNVGYIVTARPTIVDYPSGGESDVNVNGNILKTTDGGETWVNMSMSKFGEGTDPSVNPKVVGCYYIDFQSVLCVSDQIALAYARWFEKTATTKTTHSAVFKTIDGGVNWKAITADLGSSVISAMKMSGNNIFIGGNKILWKGTVSDDSLVDLYPVLDENSDDAMYISEIEIFNNSEIYVTTIADGVHTSKNNGTTFTKITGLSGANDIYKYNDNVLITLGTSGNSKATINGGTSWSSCYPGKSCWEIAGVLNDTLIALYRNELYKMAVSDLIAGNYKWKTQLIDSKDENLHKIQIFNDSKALIVGYGGKFKLTTNKGLSWTDKTMPAYDYQGFGYDLRSLSQGAGGAIVSSRRAAIVDFPTSSPLSDLYTSGLILTSTDNWATWNVLNTKNIGKDFATDPSKCPTMTGCYGLDAFASECIDASTYYMYVQWYDTVNVSYANKVTHSRVFKTSDAGTKWAPVTDDFAGTFIYDISFKGDTGYIAGNNIYQRTTDGGASFTDIFPKLSAGTDGSLIVNITKMKSGKEIYVATSTDGIFYSKDAGETFTKLDNISGASDMILLDNNSFMSVGSSTKTKFTNDAGQKWIDCYPGTTIWIGGEILNDSLYVLCKSNVYKVAVAALDIKTSSKNIRLTNELKVFYGATELKLVSSDNDIDRCFVYNMEGKLVTITEPRSKTCSFSYSSFNPGIYIISAETKGKKYIQKVLFK